MTIVSHTASDSLELRSGLELSSLLPTGTSFGTTAYQVNRLKNFKSAGSLFGSF